MDSPSVPPAEPRKRARSSAVQRERQELAQRLHNTICQELTGICFLAGAAAHRHGSVESEAGRKFEEIATLIQRAGAGLAEIVHDLHADPDQGEPPPRNTSRP